VDLAEWFRAKRWVALLELIDMLPAASRLNEAIANDPEAAKAIAAASQGRESEPWAPRTSEWDLHATMLGDIATKLDRLGAILIKVNGGNPGDVKPFPTPKTEIQAAMKAAEREWAVQFAGQFGFSAEDL
jgi:hypothetical protein